MEILFIEVSGDLCVCVIFEGRNSKPKVNCIAAADSRISLMKRTRSAVVFGAIGTGCIMRFFPLFIYTSQGRSPTCHGCLYCVFSKESYI